LGNGGATYSEMASVTRPGQVMDLFDQVTRRSMMADAAMLGAIGQPSEADKVVAQAGNFGPDATVSVIETTIAVQGEAMAALKRGLNGKVVALDDAGKARFAQALLELAWGVRQYAALAPELPRLKRVMQGTGNAARSAFYASKTMAASLGEMKATLKAAAGFARANGVPVGAEVDDALGP
jgi:hypothetical protein